MSLLDLALLTLRLGLLSFGGGITVLPELQRELVDVRGLMTSREFAEAYALGQMTPGPGMLYLIPVGNHVAGAAGAVLVLLTFIVPPLILQLALIRQERRFLGSPRADAARKALIAMSLGLSGASVYVLAHPLIGEATAVAGIVVGAVAVVVFKVNPAIIVLGAAVAGALGIF